MNFNKKSTFLITGGAGFIGTNLVRKILESGAEVIVVDNLMSGKKDNLPKNKKLLVLEKSVQDVDLNKFSKVSGVFHLAAQASVPLSISNFYASSKNNNESSLKIIDYCALNKIPLVYASSSAVYGNIAMGEEGKEIDLLHPYSVDKYILELYTKMAYEVYGLRSCGLRFFNVYGPYQDGTNPYSGVISIFIERLLEGKNITIYGGNQTRDFIYIDDVIDAMILSMKFLENNKVFEVFNVLSNRSTSVNKIASKIAKVIDIVPQIKYLPLSTTDPMVSAGKADNIFNKLKFYPKIDIDQGLSLTINWMQAELEK